MAEEYQYTLEDIGIYRPIVLAPEFIEEQNISALEKTIEELGRGIGVRSKDLPEFASVARTNPESLQNLILNFSGKYRKSLHSQKIKDLRGYYSDLFEEYYTEENLLKVDKDFDSEETYESVLNRYNNAQNFAKLRGEEYKDQVEQAKKDKKELDKIVLPLTEFEGLRLDSLRIPAKRKSLKDRLNSLYEEEKEDKKK